MMKENVVLPDVPLPWSDSNSRAGSFFLTCTLFPLTDYLNKKFEKDPKFAKGFWEDLRCKRTRQE
jgi:hypothetical protein